MLYTHRFFSSKCSLFHNANLFGSCIIHILYTGCAFSKMHTKYVLSFLITYRVYRIFVRNVTSHDQSTVQNCVMILETDKFTPYFIARFTFRFTDFRPRCTEAMFLPKARVRLFHWLGLKRRFSKSWSLLDRLASVCASVSCNPIIVKKIYLITHVHIRYLRRFVMPGSSL